MVKRILKRTSGIAKWKLIKYTNYIKKNQGEGEPNVTQFIEKIQKINVSPQHLRELGLNKDWQKEVSTQYIEKVVNTAERFKKDLKELSKR